MTGTEHKPHQSPSAPGQLARRRDRWSRSLPFLALCLAVSPVHAGIQNDTFDRPVLGKYWSFKDPNGNDAISLTARPGWLQVQVNGPDEDIWTDGHGGAPLLIQGPLDSRSDFAVETYVDLATSNGGYPALNAIGGLVLINHTTETEKSPFELTLGLQHNWTGGTEVILQKPGHSFKWASPGANAAHLRLERDATRTTWIAFYKVHAEDSWTQLAELNGSDLPSQGKAQQVSIGLFSKTWDVQVGRGANIDFAYFGTQTPDDSAEASPLHTGITSLQTFCVSGKERTVLNGYREAELLRHQGRGCLTHMWFGGDWPDYERTRIRIYVDGEQRPSIVMQLGLGHGVGFADDAAPWGSSRLGKTGHPSGFYNTYKIPFGNGIRVTAQRDEASPDGAPFWWIVRGTENLTAEIAGVQLPINARLRLHKLEDYLAQPYEEFDLCKVPGAGAVYQVTMAADGQRDNGDWKDISYLEAIVRAYLDHGQRCLNLSSGLEDYFLGTYYFNRGRFANALAGLTHLDTKTNTFSAYRFHDDDPLFFHQGLRLTCRCGEEIGGKKLHDPPRTRFTTYVWLYQW